MSEASLNTKLNTWYELNIYIYKINMSYSMFTSKDVIKILGWYCKSIIISFSLANNHYNSILFCVTNENKIIFTVNFTIYKN